MTKLVRVCHSVPNQLIMRGSFGIFVRKFKFLGETYFTAVSIAPNKWAYSLMGMNLFLFIQGNTEMLNLKLGDLVIYPPRYDMSPQIFRQVGKVVKLYGGIGRRKVDLLINGKIYAFHINGTVSNWILITIKKY